jgi:hypothetical protein
MWGGVQYLNQHKTKTGFRPTRHLENGERACVHTAMRRERKEEEMRGGKTMTDMICSAAASWTQLLFRSSNVPAVGMMRDSLLSQDDTRCPGLFAGHVCFAVLVDVRRKLSG